MSRLIRRHLFFILLLLNTGVRLGTALDPEQVSASYVDGRLTVTVGAVPAAQPRRVEISTTPAPAIEASAEDAQPENGTSDNA